MRFPDLVTVKAVDATDRQPIKNVALLLTLFAAQKNNYGVGPKITDEDGIAKFSRADCERHIRGAKEMFIMDYSGDLASCHPYSEFHTHRPEHIQTMLSNYRQSPVFWGIPFDEPQKLFSALERVANADFEYACLRLSEAQLLENPQVELPLRRSSSPRH